MIFVDANRTSELAALDTHIQYFKPLATLIKKRVVGAPPKEVFCGAYPHDKRLCVVDSLKHSETFTEEQTEKDGQESKLFLSYVKPHQPVTFQCWVKDLLQITGVDAKVFKTHSARVALRSNSPGVTPHC